MKKKYLIFLLSEKCDFKFSLLLSHKPSIVLYTVRYLNIQMMGSWIFKDPTITD